MAYSKRIDLTQKDEVGYLNGNVEIDGAVSLSGYGSQYLRILSESQDLTLSGATSTLTGFIPKGCFLLGLSAKVITAVTGATTWDLGDGSDADCFANDKGLTVGTVTTQADYTAEVLKQYTSATSIVATANGSNFTAGKLRVTMFFIRLAS